MLSYALLFFLLAIVAGVLGFGGFVVGSLALVAKWLVAVFVILWLVALVTGRGPVVPTDPY